MIGSKKIKGGVNINGWVSVRNHSWIRNSKKNDFSECHCIPESSIDWVKPTELGWRSVVSLTVLTYRAFHIRTRGHLPVERETPTTFQIKGFKKWLQTKSKSHHWTSYDPSYLSWSHYWISQLNSIILISSILSYSCANMRFISSPIYLAILTLLVHMVVAVPVPTLTDEQRREHLTKYIHHDLERQRHEARSHRHAEWTKVTDGPQKDSHEAKKQEYASLAQIEAGKAAYHHSQLNSGPSRSRRSSSGSSDGDPFQYTNHLSRDRTPSPNRVSSAAR